VAYARASLGGPQSRIQVYEDVYLIAEGNPNANVPLVRLFDASGNRIVSVFRQNQVSNKVYVAYGGVNYLIASTLAFQNWNRLGVRVLSDGTSTSITVQMNELTV